jgi:ubiquinol-cytochrome c reductase cytochrome b subunit
VFIILGYLGGTPGTPFKETLAKVLTVAYFGFFGLLWIYSKNEKTKPLPARITK